MKVTIELKTETITLESSTKDGLSGKIALEMARVAVQLLQAIYGKPELGITEKT